MRELSSMPDVVDTADVAPIPYLLVMRPGRPSRKMSMVSTTVDVSAFNPDGSLANETVSSTSLLGWK